MLFADAIMHDKVIKVFNMMVMNMKGGVNWWRLAKQL